jgi:phenylacetic acid degradation operon negative regulatory protein
MKRGLAKISKDFLESFIDFNSETIKYIVSFEARKKFLYGGAPKGFYSTIYNLKRTGYIKKVKSGSYSLTGKGKKAAAEILIRHKINKQKWDGKWRVLIFDIPENRRRFRANVRKTLYNLGFLKLQQSVWITPYNLINDLYDIIPGFREGDWFEYLEAKYISSESKIKKYFDL